MDRKNKAYTELHYFSDHLKLKLSALLSSRAAIIEAPSGYGKTTAIRDYLDSALFKDTPVFWFTAEDEAAAPGFRRFCREIDRIDGKAGQRLLKIGLPNAANLGEACDALRSVECRFEAFLVIDNFQYMQGALPASFFTAMIEHGGENLHIIVITQMLTRDMTAAAASHGVLHIGASDLRLEEEDIRRYFLLSGADISPGNAKKIERYTEGWIAAVYLQLCAYRNTGSIADTSGIFALMEKLVWGVLTIEQQTLLLRLSPFETVTARQICALLGCDTLPLYALDALNSPFIRYSLGEKRYELHSILSEVLVKKRSERGEGFERKCLLSAGDYFRDVGMADRAFDYYAQAGDYERMLSLDLSGLILEEIGGAPFYETALRIAQNCPDDIKKKHILSMLEIAWALLTAGKHAQFDILMQELGGMIEASRFEDARLLRGEWFLLSSWRCLPRLAEMTELVKRAATFFRGTCSRVILPSSPWCFGDYSQLAVFHSEPGEADREADALEEFTALYTKLTNGHGSGADVLFRAELAHYRGDLKEAEILAYKAGFLAESSRQSMIQLGAALHLAEIAVEKSDMEGWQRAIDSMERAASYPEQSSFVLRSAVEMLRSLLLNELQHQRRIDDWLKNGETGGRILPAMRRNALFIRLSYFMHKGEFARLAGMADAERETLRPSDVLADTLLSLLAAVGYSSLSGAASAEERFLHAAKIALPDGLVYLLAVYHWMLNGLPEKLIQEHYPEHLVRFIRIKERFIAGFTQLHADLEPNKTPEDLTSRELEVALLAASGLHNGEIAEKLVVAESTVRAHMRTIFQKLDIDRRAKLADKLI